MRIPVSKFLPVSILLLLVNGAALAQNATGSIRGAVADEQGAALPNATVIVTNKATESARKLTTNSDGSYAAENLQPGEYEVRIELRGFISQLRLLTVQIGRTTVVDVAMQVGGAQESVTVTADTPVIDASSNTIAGVVTQDRVDKLPLNGRGFLTLALLEPGVQVNYSAAPGAGGPNTFFSVSVAGAPANQTLISVDGIRSNERITGGTAQNFSSETVQEFQISTASFDLSSGTTAVGAVNIVSRTGANAFHGSGFFYFRDHNMSAYPSLKRDSFNPDPFFARRQSGFTLSGPIKKDRLFWFTNFEYTNQVGARTIGQYDDPIWSGYQHVAQSPLRDKQFNLRLDYKVSEKHNAFLRGSYESGRYTSTGTGNAGGLESTFVSGVNHAWQGVAGVTSVLSPRWVNDVRVGYSFFSNRLGPPDASVCAIPEFCVNLGGARISVPGGPNFGNDAQVTQHRIPRQFQITDNVNWSKGAHRVRFGGNWEHLNWHGSWARLFTGNFTLFSPTQLRLLSGNQAVAAIYNALPATLRGATAGRPSLADILKLPVSGALAIGVGDPGQPPAFNSDEQRKNNAYRLYIQDSWQIRPSFTLNYGVAWSFEDNLLSRDLDKPEYLRPALGDNLKPTRQDWNNFDPALGFAWSPGKSKKTVIRAGSGIFHQSAHNIYQRLGERGFIGPAGNGLVTLATTLFPNPFFAPGNGQAPTLFFNAPTPFTGQNMMALIPTIKAAFQGMQGAGTDLSVRGVNVNKQANGLTNESIYDSDVTTGYSFQVNAGVQRAIAWNMGLSVDYVMRRGVHFGAFESFFVDVNHFNRRVLNPATNAFVQSPVIPLCATAQYAPPRVDVNAQCSSGTINLAMSALNSRYNSVNVKVDKRFTEGFLFTVSYAFSRYTRWNGVLNLDNFLDSYGIAPEDITHRLTANAAWETPTYKGDNRLMRGLLNGWQLATILELRSAPPADARVTNVDLDGDGVSTTLLPGLKINSFGRGASADDIRRLVDAYNQTYAGKRDTFNRTIGAITLPANFSNGDPFFSQDLRVTRTIKIGENVKLTLIGEGFNIFNIANNIGYSSTLGTSTGNYGQPTDRVNQVFGSGGPRAFQLAARISF